MILTYFRLWGRILRLARQLDHLFEILLRHRARFLSVRAICEPYLRDPLVVDRYRLYGLYPVSLIILSSALL